MILTFILTLIICSQILNNPRPNDRLPEISLLGVDAAYSHFVAGFAVLSVQILIVTIGRLQFLFQSQALVHRIILCALHLLLVISSIFLLIMAIMDVKRHPRPHIIGAINTFAFLSAYTILHTIIAIYLFIKRAQAPEHASIIWPLWFLACCITLVICFATWGGTSLPTPQYIAATIPFLYILGFIPQFWRQARKKSENTDTSLQTYL